MPWHGPGLRSEMFEQARAVLFDLDGTIYYGTQIIDGANECIEHCRNLSKRVFFLTNNSTKTRGQIYGRLRGMGVNCSCDEVMTSGYAAALYARQEELEGIYICGSRQLAEEFEALDVPLADADAAKHLLIGYDPDFDYGKLTDAVRVALQADTILACNKERVYRGQDAKLFPGCGGMVAPIEWCAGRSSDYVIGKPNTFMLEVLARHYGYTPSEMLVVGDTYESDILMANRFGCPSVLISPQQYADTVSVSAIGELTNLLG